MQPALEPFGQSLQFPFERDMTGRGEREIAQQLDGDQQQGIGHGIHHAEDKAQGHPQAVGPQQPPHFQGK